MTKPDPHAAHDTGADHAGHDHIKGASARSLRIALGLTSLILVAELAGSYVFNSLALLSDAGHMFTDTAALVIALIAVRIGARPADDKRTYGYRRFEILAAAFNAILLVMIALFVLYEAVARLLRPADVQSLGMLGVATIGLVANIVSMRVLAGGRDESFNIKGAYLEVWADMIGSLGVLIAAAVIYATGWTGSIRWSRRRSGCGYFRAHGCCCAIPATSCFRVCPRGSILKRCGSRSMRCQGCSRSTTSTSGRWPATTSA